MAQYLLDTSICVFFMRGKYNMKDIVNQVGHENCFISEVTIAELMYGAQCSERKQENLALCKSFAQSVNIVPFCESIDTYSSEKARLRKAGTPVEDFDLLIGCTALAKGMTLVTDNVRHFERIEGIKIENWVQR